MSVQGARGATIQGVTLARSGTVDFRLVGTSAPGEPADAPELLAELLEAAGSALDAAGGGLEDVAAATIFLDVSAGQREERIARCRAVLERAFGVSPAAAFVPQPSLDGGPVALDLTAIIERPRGAVLTRLDAGCALYRDGDVRRAWVTAAQASGREQGAYEESLATLERAEARLRELDLGLECVLRAWFYIPELLAAGAEGQRYQSFNEARAVFYDQPRSRRYLEGLRPARLHALPPGYPASTGIGADHGSIVVTLEAATAPEGQLEAWPIENPAQEDAHRYPDSVLRPSRVGGGEPPRFSRGLIERWRGVPAILRVSGTASILDAQTRHRGDVVAQTHTTLDNIAELVSAQNLTRYGLSAPPGGARLAVLRAYVRHAGDLERVRAVCAERYPEVPILYLRAEVCRDDLLVEIEGEAVNDGGGAQPQLS